MSFSDNSMRMKHKQNKKYNLNFEIFYEDKAFYSKYHFYCIKSTVTNKETVFKN